MSALLKANLFVPQHFHFLRHSQGATAPRSTHRPILAAMASFSAVAYSLWSNGFALVHIACNAMLDRP